MYKQFPWTLVTVVSLALICLLITVHQTAGLSRCVSISHGTSKIVNSYAERTEHATLYGPGQWFGGRIGEVTCSDSLGMMKPWSCAMAVRGMPQYVWNTRSTPASIYGTASIVAAEQSLPKDLHVEGGYYEMPVVYSFRSCAVVVKPVSRGESFDVAVTNAIKQTALNIKKACLPDTGRGAAQGAGGWQIAGAHGNLNITIFSVVDPEFSKLQRTNTKVEINQPSTLADVNYQKVVRQRTGGPMYPSMSDADFCSMGYVYDLVHGCCPGFKYVEETVTEANVETFSTILGVAYQSLLNLGKIGWCGVPGFTTTVSQTTEV